jgi:type III pantothenate kinase
MNHPTTANDHFWLALMIGSSHLHWAWFQGKELLTAWDTPHLKPEIAQELIQGGFADDLWPQLLSDPPQPPFKRGEQSLQVSDPPQPPGKKGEQSLQVSDPPQPPGKKGVSLWIASVVPEQTQLWQRYAQAKAITLDHLPLRGLYPTLGIDRALAALGAGEKFGFPVLVVDAGTAMTFTGVNSDRQLVGGAILPGFRLQLKSLWTGTASLPDVAIPQELPDRWGLNTPSSIQSGVIYSIVAGVRDFIEAWWQDYPQGNVVVTGGGGPGLLAYLRSRDSADSAIASRAISDPHLVFWGMEMIVNG